MKITKLEENGTKMVVNVKIPMRNLREQEEVTSIGPRKLLSMLLITSPALKPLRVEGLSLSNKAAAVDTDYTVYKVQKEAPIASAIENVENVTNVKRTVNRKKPLKNNETKKTTQNTHQLLRTKDLE